MAKESETQFLIRHGWILEIVGKSKTTGRPTTKYWSHPKYKREDSSWWPQGVAYLHQRMINRTEGKKAND